MELLSSLAIDGEILHQSATRGVRSASGLYGLSPVRRSVRPRPSADGSIDESRYLDEKLVTIDGAIYKNSTYAAAYAEFRILAQAFRATLETPGILTWTEEAGGLSLQKAVKLAGPVEPPIESTGGIIQYAVVFASPDPNSYSQTLQTVTGAVLSAVGGGDSFSDLMGADTFAPAVSGTSTFTNAGNANTRPLLRLYGYASGAAVVLGSKRISLTGDIASGDYIEIDLHSRKLTKVSGGVRTNAAGQLDPANTQWFSLPPGASNLQMTAGSFDANARLDIVGRSAYT